MVKRPEKRHLKNMMMTLNGIMMKQNVHLLSQLW